MEGVLPQDFGSSMPARCTGSLWALWSCNSAAPFFFSLCIIAMRYVSAAPYGPVSCVDKSLHYAGSFWDRGGYLVSIVPAASCDSHMYESCVPTVPQWFLHEPCFFRPAKTMGEIIVPASRYLKKLPITDTGYLFLCGQSRILGLCHHFFPVECEKSRNHSFSIFSRLFEYLRSNGVFALVSLKEWILSASTWTAFLFLFTALTRP